MQQVHEREVYELGNCVGSEKHDLFFSDRPAELAEAQALCAECLVQLPCLELALRNGEEWGVWGGMIFWEGQPFYRRRARGRPRRSEQGLPLEADPAELWELVRSA
jgi:WhiB family redox-sensing transcriptional regulator